MNLSCWRERRLPFLGTITVGGFVVVGLSLFFVIHFLGCLSWNPSNNHGERQKKEDLGLFDSVPIWNGPKIDLVLRTYSEDLSFVLVLLRSFEMFFPKGMLGEFFVILDVESEKDQMMGRMLPSYVKVIYEADVPGIPQFRGFGLNSHREVSGWIRSQISNFLSDQYGTSPYIGVLDADVSFDSPCLEDLLFRNGKPVIGCTEHRDLGMESLRAMDPNLSYLNPFDCNHKWPVLLKRSIFGDIRQWLKSRTGLGFPENLMNLTSSKLVAWSNLAAFGSYAYHYRHDDYHWAIGGKGSLATCPELLGSQHPGYFDNPRNEVPKFSRDYFHKAAKGLAHASCRIEKVCFKEEGSVSKECEKMLKKYPDYLFQLSVEGRHSLLWHPNKMSQKCKKQYENRVESCNSIIKKKYCPIQKENKRK